MTALSDIDKQIAELEAKKKALIKKEKDDAMDKVKTALAELNALGFNYSLSDGTTTTRTTRTRRSGVRNDVLALIKKSPSGLTRAAKPVVLAPLLLHRVRGRTTALLTSEAVTLSSWSHTSMTCRLRRPQASWPVQFPKRGIRRRGRSQRPVRLKVSNPSIIWSLTMRRSQQWVSTPKTRNASVWVMPPEASCVVKSQYQ